MFPEGLYWSLTLRPYFLLKAAPSACAPCGVSVDGA
jgi:hypothetical protein